MSKKMVAAALVVVALGAASSACSNNEAPAKSAPTSAAPSSAQPSATTDTKAGVSRAEGAKQYEALVVSFNKEFDRCMKVVNPIEESMASSPSDFPKIRKACADIGDANREFGEGLEAKAWPAEVKADISKLIDEVRADQLAWDDLGKVRGHDDLFNPAHPFSGGDSASLVRAHLGLPPREDVVDD